MKPNQKPRTPEEAQALKNRVVAAICAGHTVRAIAIDNATTETYIYTSQRRIGFEKMLLSVDERWVIDQLRQKKGKFVELKPADKPRR
jgi:hypothetical protein